MVPYDGGNEMLATVHDTILVPFEEPTEDDA